MATWVGTIVETKETPDFWALAAKHRVQRVERPGSQSTESTAGIPAHVLIDCEIGLGTDFEASFRLAEALSRELSTRAVGFAIQTTASVLELQCFMGGRVVRRLEYSGDGGGWLLVEGEPQAWEPVFFFGHGTTATDGDWPDVLWDELSDDDVRRYEEAKRAGDPSSIMDLLHVSSTGPMQRVCTWFRIDGNEPSGLWKKRSLFSRIFGRG